MKTLFNPAPIIKCAFVDFTNSHKEIWVARHTRHAYDGGCRDDVVINKYTKRKLNAWGVNPF